MCNPHTTHQTIKNHRSKWPCSLLRASKSRGRALTTRRGFLTPSPPRSASCSPPRQTWISFTSPSKSASPNWSKVSFPSFPAPSSFSAAARTSACFLTSTLPSTGTGSFYKTATPFTSPPAVGFKSSALLQKRKKSNSRPSGCASTRRRCVLSHRATHAGTALGCPQRGHRCAGLAGHHL
jgi:hypothetical protein